MSWLADIADLDADIFGTGGFGEPVTWPNGKSGTAIVTNRQDQRYYETGVTEPVWTLEFRRSEYSPVRGETLSMRGAAWAFGERIDAADDFMDAWSIQRL